MNEQLLRDVIGMDRGAVPKEMQVTRGITFDWYGCNGEKDPCTLYPNDKVTVKKCKGKSISWEGIIYWDGRHITGKEKNNGER